MPVRSSARNASCGRGEGEKGERRRNEITGQWTKYLRPPHCPLGPPLFPTRGLRSVTGQRGGNYPATVLYLLRRRRDCVPPRHVCSPLPPPSPSPPLATALSASGTRFRIIHAAAEITHRSPIRNFNAGAREGGGRDGLPSG